MPKKAPRLNPELVRQQIELQQRDPFIDLLTTYLSAQPSREAIRQFAEKWPHRWAQSVGVLAKLAGYHDKLRVESNVFLDVHRLSDLEIEVEFEKLKETLLLEDENKCGVCTLLSLRTVFSNSLASYFVT